MIKHIKKYFIIITLFSLSTALAQNIQSLSLHQAVMRGDIEKARSLLEDGADVDELDEYFQTPLMIAVLNNDDKMAQLILKYKPNAHITYKSGDTVLHMAVFKTNKTMAIHLLKYDPTLVNRKNHKGQTAAYYTVNDRSLDMIQILEHYAMAIGKYDIFFEVQDSRGNSLLHEAVKAGNLPLTKHLAAKGIKIKLKNYKGNSAIHFTFKNKKPDIAIFLVANDADIDEENNFRSTPILMSIIGDNLPLTVFYIEQGANLLRTNNANISPLELAYQRSHKKIHYSKHESRTRYNIYDAIKKQVDKNNSCSTSFQPH